MTTTYFPPSQLPTMSTTFHSFPQSSNNSIYLDYLSPEDTTLLELPQLNVDLSSWSQDPPDLPYRTPLEQDWPARSYYTSSESDQRTSSSPMDFTHLDAFDSFSPHTGVRTLNPQPTHYIYNRIFFSTGIAAQRPP